jgi:hypothetical protein
VGPKKPKRPAGKQQQQQQQGDKQQQQQQYSVREMMDFDDEDSDDEEDNFLVSDGHHFLDFSALVGFPFRECLLHVSTFATTRVALPTGVEPV